MKRALLIIILTITTNLTYATISDVFTIEENNIATQMQDLNTLEQFVMSNPDLTLTELQSTHPMLTSNILKQEESPFSQLSLLTNSKYASGDDGCIWIVACSCCVSSTVGFIFYYLEYMVSMM
jgi:hypothetical protein